MPTLQTPSIASVVEDQSPSLGGNLDCAGLDLSDIGDLTAEGTATFNGTILATDGAIDEPSISFVNSPDMGFARATINQMRWFADSAGKGVNFGRDSFKLHRDADLQWNSATNMNQGSADLSLSRDDADILAQRRTTSAQTFRVYNTYTDASNYERGVFDWQTTADRLTIGTQAAGTGTARDVYLVRNGDTRIGTNATTTNIYSSSGNLNLALQTSRTVCYRDIVSGSAGSYDLGSATLYWGDTHLSQTYIDYAGAGTAANPSLVFAERTQNDTGFFMSSANSIAVSVIGVAKFRFMTNEVRVADEVSIGWSTSGTLSSTNSAEFFYEAVGTVGLVDANADSACALNVYNTRTDASNYERAVIDWTTTANTLTIGAQAAGAGTERPVEFVGSTIRNAAVKNYFGTNANSPWIMTHAGTSYSTADIDGKGMSFRSAQNDSSSYGFTFSGSTLTHTTGNSALMYLTRPFSPASGSTTYSYLYIRPSITQTGTGSGIVRGLYLNVANFVDVQDYRAIDIDDVDAAHYAIKTGTGKVEFGDDVDLVEDAGNRISWGTSNLSIGQYSTSDSFDIKCSGARTHVFGVNSFIGLQSDGMIHWSDSATSAALNSTQGDTSLLRPDPQTLQIRDTKTATNPCSFQVTNTYTDASNYERGIFDWTTTANTLTIGTEAAGTGTLRNVEIVGGGIILDGSSVAVQSIMNMGGDMIDFGSSAAIRWNSSRLEITERFSSGVARQNWRNNGIIEMQGDGPTDPATVHFINTYTDDSNYERGVFDWTTTANVLTIGAQAAGTGTERGVEYVGASHTFDGDITVPTNGGIATNNFRLKGSRQWGWDLTSSGKMGVPVDSQIAFSTANAATGADNTFDVRIDRDDVGILSIHDTTVNPTSLRVYNTYTDASNYERGIFDWTTTANTLTIGAQAAGTGTLRNVRIGHADDYVRVTTTGVQVYCGTSIKISVSDYSATFYDNILPSADGSWSVGDSSKRFGGGYFNKLNGQTSTAADPTTTEYPNDKDWGIHKNTSSGNVFLAYNDGGSTIVKVQLT